MTLAITLTEFSRVGVKNNSILDNTVRRNLGYGIRLEKAGGNTIRNNSLDENLPGVFDDGLNLWDENYYGGRPAAAGLIDQGDGLCERSTEFPVAEVLMSTPDMLWL